MKRKKPYFIVGVGNSTCADCCHTEHILEQLDYMTEQGILSLTEDAKKGGKWEGKRVHKKIPIARVDLADTADMKLFQAQGYKFEDSQVYIVHGDREIKLDLTASIDDIVHQMQRIMVPLVELKSEEDVQQFLDTSVLTAWKHDYEIGKSGLYRSLKPDSEWAPANIDKKIEQFGAQTRLVMFITDKELYENEYSGYLNAAWTFS